MLTNQDIETLNLARMILQRLERDGFGRYDYGGGRLAEACDRADDAVFQVLNVANVYCGAAISDDMLHNRAQEPVV